MWDLCALYTADSAILNLKALLVVKSQHRAAIFVSPGRRNRGLILCEKQGLESFMNGHHREAQSQCRTRAASRRKRFVVEGSSSAPSPQQSISAISRIKASIVPLVIRGQAVGALGKAAGGIGQSCIPQLSLLHF